MNEKIVSKGNAIIVAVYKTVGFAILIVILVGLLSYLGVQGFFLVNDSWVSPTIISPTDEKVLGLNTRLAELTAERERLQAERREMEARLADAERKAEAHARFQQRFVAALRGDRAARAAELRRLLALRGEHRRADEEIAESNRAYSGLSRTRAEALQGVGLIDREGYLTTNYQLAQIANSNLSLAERGIDLHTRIAALRREVRSLDAAALLASGGKPPEPLELSATVLLLHRQFDASRLEGTGAEQMREVLRANLVALDGALDTYDRLLAAIRNSPYMKAIDSNVTVAFVPYDNMARVRPGEPLYGCSIGFVWCREVGVVNTVYDGEVSMRHPVRQMNLRGSMVEIDLHDPRWARAELLHLGGAPLLF